MSARAEADGGDGPADRTGPVDGRSRLTRLAIVMDRYAPLLGGAERDVHVVARGLAGRGVSVTVLTRRHGSEQARRERRDGVHVHRLGLAELPVPRPVALLVFGRSVERHLRRHPERYDAVLAVPLTFYSDLLPVHRAHRRTGVPYVVQTASSGDFPFMLGEPDGSLRSWLRGVFAPRRTWTRVLADASAVTVQSEAVARIATDHGVSDVTTIPNGVECDRFRPARRGERRRLRRVLELPEEAFIVANAGRLAKGKNQETLIRAIQRLHAKHRAGAGPIDPPREVRETGSGEGPESPPHLLLLGAREPYDAHSNEGEIRDLVRRGDLESAVTLRFDVERVEDFLRASDLFVFPSLLDEGMPNALLEAMACGLPCVCADSPPVRAVATEETGVFVTGEDADEMARGIESLRRNRRARRRLGRAGRARVERHFGSETAVRRYRRLLESVSRRDRADTGAVAE